MSAQASLFDAVPAVKRARADAAEAWRERVRAALLARHAGERVTIDHAVALIAARPELRRPPEVHSNAAGRLFSHWPAARPVMVGEGEDRVQLTVISPRDRNRVVVWQLNGLA